jgi:hypothetical protein
VSLGGNWLHARYQSLGGADLQNGSLQTAKNINVPVLPGLSSATARVRLSSDTFVGFAQAGVTPSLDVGVAVPFVGVSLGLDGFQFYDGGHVVSNTLISDTNASGLGDVAVYMKYRLTSGTASGVAATAEVRLPTGDKNELRGLGVTRTLVSLVWSKAGRVSPHANVGYEFWSSEVPLNSSGSVAARNQVRYAAGVEFDASPHLTVLLDGVGRHISGGGTLSYTTFPTLAGGTLDALVAIPQGLDAVSLAPGVKWNAFRNCLITANVLASVKNAGLTARWVPVIGFDFAF